ncbi:hypothetical protein GUJ93_ZPchr0011g28227 [Zizania palustris]|uniref:Uncharacterized protein n=1 Tax=Zizania palustris TaxID=103762 RepID=A0A8J5WGD8_ZIZPA|nr:hypothetical protein GUJ93_ZPchr0011g28227 [Zizania palustris]
MNIINPKQKQRIKASICRISRNKLIKVEISVLVEHFHQDKENLNVQTSGHQKNTYPTQASKKTNRHPRERRRKKREGNELSPGGLGSAREARTVLEEEEEEERAPRIAADGRERRARRARCIRRAPLGF